MLKMFDEDRSKRKRITTRRKEKKHSGALIGTLASAAGVEYQAHRGSKGTPNTEDVRYQRPIKGQTSAGQIFDRNIQNEAASEVSVNRPADYVPCANLNGEEVCSIAFRFQVHRQVCILFRFERIAIFKSVHPRYRQLHQNDGIRRQ